MVEALKRTSTFACKTETTFGVDPSIASTDVMEIVDFAPNDSYDSIERLVVSNSLDPLAPIRGAETLDGNIDIELHGSGTAGNPPESSPLWKGGVGPQTATTATTVANPATGATTTNVPLTTGGVAASGLAVGDAILINPDGAANNNQVTWITAIATDDLTVSPALSAAPVAGQSVGAGVHYKLSTTALASFFCSFWRGNIVREDYSGCKIEDISMDFSSGSAVLPSFKFQGKAQGTPVTEIYGLGPPAYDSGGLHVARYATFSLDGTTTPVTNAALSIAHDQVRRLDITSSGTNSIIATGRTVSGSFSLPYSDSALETAFMNDTNAELVIVTSDGGLDLTVGNTFAIRMPQIRYSSAAKTEDSGIYQYDMAFTAAKDVAVSGESSITSVSFL